MWFQSKKISDSTTAIIDITGVRIFLIEGKDRAAVIDTGTGIGNLRQYLATLTNLPYDVILTHGHVDHGGGAGAFEQVYLDPDDYELYKVHCTLEKRKGYAAFTVGDKQNDIVESDYQIGTPKFLDLSKKQEFDLGGLTLEMIKVPGHTHGMTCVLLKEEHTLILGDACNAQVFLFDQEATSVKKYQHSLEKVILIQDEFDRTWYSHGPAEQPKSILPECFGLTKLIEERKDDKVPFSFMGLQAYMAKAVKDDGITRVDGRMGNIIYSISKL